MNKPHRRYTLTLTIGADTIEALRFELREIESRFPDVLETSWPVAVSGGPDSSSTMNIAYDPAVTHDSYFEALDKWLEELRNHEQNAAQ